MTNNNITSIKNWQQLLPEIHHKITVTLFLVLGCLYILQLKSKIKFYMKYVDSTYSNNKVILNRST